MRVKKGFKYSINNSDVVVKILSIVHECEEYQKVKTVIYHKRTFDVVERPKYYKLDSERIKHWEVYRG